MVRKYHIQEKVNKLTNNNRLNGGFLLYTDNKMKYKQFIIPILLFLSLFACTLIENKQFINIIMTLFWLYELSTLFLCTAIYLYCFGDFDKKVKNKIANALGNISTRNNYLNVINISSLVLIAFNGWIVTTIVFIVIFMFSRFLVYCAKDKLNY